MGHESREFSDEEWHVLDCTSDFNVYFFELATHGRGEPRLEDARRVLLDMLHRGLVEIGRERPRRRRRRVGRHLTRAEAEAAIVDPQNWSGPKSDRFTVGATEAGGEAYVRAYKERFADFQEG